MLLFIVVAKLVQLRCKNTIFFLNLQIIDKKNLAITREVVVMGRRPEACVQGQMSTIWLLLPCFLL